jgi:hypothetical protein
VSATARSWARLDLATREFWRVAGRPVDLAGSEQWLDAPCGGAATIGAEWFESAATALGGCVDRDAADAGLIADLTVLDGPDFSAASLHPLVREFYEHSARFRLEAWSQWSPFFAPGGMVVTQVFGRRIQQLALPVRPLDLARGMDSQVVPVMDATGHQRWAGWIRRLRSTGDVVFSGAYGHALLPGARSRSVHVAFPLEQGNVQVFLRPRSLPTGGLELLSGTRASCEPTTSCVSGRRPHSACTTGWTGGRVRGRLDASPESTRRGEHAAYRKNVRCG